MRVYDQVAIDALKRELASKKSELDSIRSAASLPGSSSSTRQRLRDKVTEYNKLVDKLNELRKGREATASDRAALNDWFAAEYAKWEAQQGSQSRSSGPGQHTKGFDQPQHGWIGDKPVTFALGWGGNEGHTLLADGHLTDAEFRNHHQHDHYGPGKGPNNNGTLRKKYTGPGA